MVKGYPLVTDRMKSSVQCLAKNLKALRLACGWSQEVLASYIGVTRQTILAIENGKREMTWTMFLALTLLFSGNEDSRQALLDTGAYTGDLDKFLGLGSNSDN